MLSSMMILMRRFICFNLKGMRKHHLLILYVEYTKIYIGSNRHPKLGFTSYLLLWLAWAFMAQRFIIDSSMFVQFTGDRVKILLVYMDDIILTRNGSSYLKKLTKLPSFHISPKDLGDLSFFLNIEIIRTISLLHLKTPMSSASSLATSDGDTLLDPTTCTSLVKGLQYCVFTRLDIVFF